MDTPSKLEGILRGFGYDKLSVYGEVKLIVADDGNTIYSVVLETEKELAEHYVKEVLKKGQRVILYKEGSYGNKYTNIQILEEPKGETSTD